MKIRVEYYAGYRGEETPRRLRFDDRSIEIVEVVDRWLGPDYRYFKVRGIDHAIYIIRQDIFEYLWEMTLCQPSPFTDQVERPRR